MQDAGTLLAFFAIVLAVILVPGMDMAYVFASAIGGGRRGGFSAVAGIVCGCCLHLLAGLTGLAALLSASQPAFAALMWIGMAYVAWIGVQLFRTGAAMPDEARGAGGARQAFRRGVTTSLLNPKAYLFMVAVLPQFAQPRFGPLWKQALVLGGIISLTQVAVYGALALGGAGCRSTLAQRPLLLKRIGQSMGALLVLTAAISLLRTVQAG